MPSSGEIWNLACKFAVGVCFAYVSHRVEGILCISSLLGAIFLFYRDIFSVAKDKNQTDLPEVKLMTIYVNAGF